MRPGVRAVRGFVSGILVAAVVAVLGLVAISHAAPALGYQLVIIRGPSMEPTIPLGALVFESPADPARIAPGAIVTMTLPSGTVVTHRVVAVGASSGEATVETRGDANEAADPSPVPVAAVTGIVAGHVPYLGYALAWLQLPSGMVSVLALLGSLLAGLLLLEELDDDAIAEAEATVPAGPGSARLEA